MDQDNKTQTQQENKSSRKTIYIIIGVIAVLFVGKILMGSMMRSATGVDINKNMDGSSTYKTEYGEVNYGGNSLPDNWPSDAPKYPNAVIQYSLATDPKTGEAGSMVMFTTSDSLQNVADFYKSKLSSEGWNLESTTGVSGMTILNSKKDSRNFFVQIAGGDDGKTTVSVAVTKSK